MTYEAASMTYDAASLSLAGNTTLVTIVGCLLLLGTAVRKRVPGVIRSLQGQKLLQRVPFAGTLLGWAHTGLAWLALLCFAVAGLAASGTFVGSIVNWAARTLDDVANGLIHLLPSQAQIPGSLGVSVLGLWAFWKGLHLIADILEGRAHHGGSDWLVFFGPMIFTLVPGLFGHFWAEVYSDIGNWVGSTISSWV